MSKFYLDNINNLRVENVGFQTLFPLSFALIADVIWVQGNAIVDVQQEDRRDIGEAAGRLGFKCGVKPVK